MPKIKIRPNYSKLNRERRCIEGTDMRQQEETIGFFDMLAGKHVEAKLTTGEILTGILETNGYNRYDVMLRNDEGLYVIRKDVLEYVKLYHNREGLSNT